MKVIAKNKKANYDYALAKKYEAGIVLTGNEIKSIRQGKVSLIDTYVRISKNYECEVINLHISQYDHQHTGYASDERRTRKLLLHKKEIRDMSKKIKEQGYTVIPVVLYLKNNHAKLEIALAKGKKNYDKRETIKQREVDRKLQKMLK